MNARFFSSAILGWLLVAAALTGCGHRQPPVSIPQVSPPTVQVQTAAATAEVEPTTLVERVDVAIQRAADYLAARQSTDGAWRSDVYGTFKNGDGLTAEIAVALLNSCDDPEIRSAVTRAVGLMNSFIQDGNVGPVADELTYPTYTAAAAVILLSTRPEHQNTAARDAWLDYLCQRQLTEPLGWSPDDARYGGWGYAAHPTVRPADGAPLGNLAEPNLSATVYALAALRAAGRTADDPAVQRGRQFIERCQNFAPRTDGGSSDNSGISFDDGGFTFVLDDPVRNKAGLAGVDPFGRKRYVSYGSATADGLRGLLLCGARPDDPRVVAAWRWFERNFSATFHPGSYPADRVAAQQSVYFYYCRALAECLPAASLGPRRRWAADVAEALLARQAAEGSWRNTAVDVREDDPLVATPAALGALVRCRAILSQTD